MIQIAVFRALSARQLIEFRRPVFANEDFSALTARNVVLGLLASTGAFRIEEGTLADCNITSRPDGTFEQFVEEFLSEGE